MPKRLMERELSTRVGNGLLAPMLFNVVRSFSRFPSIYWIGHRHDQEGVRTGKMANSSLFEDGQYFEWRW